MLGIFHIHRLFGADKKLYNEMMNFRPKIEFTSNITYMISRARYVKQLWAAFVQ